MMPLPPISVSTSSSAQSAARADSYQGGVFNQPFTGDFSVYGGGTQNTNSGPVITSPDEAFRQRAGISSTSANSNDWLLVTGFIVGGVLLWYSLKKK